MHQALRGMCKTNENIAHLDARHVDAFDRAEAEIFHFDFCPYLELKQLFRERSPRSEGRLRRLFTEFYGLNTGGLTQAFHDRFFAILFSDTVMANGKPNYEPILNELCLIKNRKDECAMPFSFVSKLVATHDEASPLYDRHVLAFFAGKVPPTSVAKAGFLGS